MTTHGKANEGGLLSNCMIIQSQKLVVTAEMQAALLDYYSARRSRRDVPRVRALSRDASFAVRLHPAHLNKHFLALHTSKVFE